jgi:hypothetical protein
VDVGHRVDDRQCSQASANNPALGILRTMAVSISLKRTGATATPPRVSEALLILLFSISCIAAAETIAKSPWRRANSMKADLRSAGQSGIRIDVTIHSTRLRA